MHLETSRLIIRAPTESDVTSSQSIWTDPVVRRYSGGPTDAKAFAEGFTKDLHSPFRPYGFNTVIDKYSDHHVGDCGLIQKKVAGTAEIEIVYFFNRNYWGKGYATEAAKALLTFAANELKLNRVVALIHPENLASIRVALKLGLTFEREITTDAGNLRRLYAIHRTIEL